MHATSEQEFQERLCCSLFGLSAGALTAIGGGLSGAGSVLGGLFSSGSSSKAAGESLFGTELSILNSQQQANTARAYQQPFVNLGYAQIQPTQAIASAQPAGTSFLDTSQGALSMVPGAIQKATNYLDLANANRPPSVVTQNWLQQQPGYQFQLDQGQKAVAASNAARGLGVSGSEMKGIGSYVTGLASSNYQNAFNNAQTNYNDILNQVNAALNLGTGWTNLSGSALSGAQVANAQQQQQYKQNYDLLSLGQAAASGAAAAGTTEASQVGNAISSGTQQYGNYTTASGQAQAAGASGVGSAATSGINNYLMYSALSNAGLFGNSITGNIGGINPQYTTNQYGTTVTTVGA